MIPKIIRNAAKYFDPGDQNPMFARAENGVGMFYFASNASLNLLESLDDPRAEVLYTKATTGKVGNTLHGGEAFFENVGTVVVKLRFIFIRE